MKFQVFHVNPGEKLMKKDDNDELIRFLINFPNGDGSIFQSVSLCNNCHILEQKKTLHRRNTKKSSKVYKSGRVFLQKKVTSYLGRYLKLPKISMIGYAIMHALYVVF